MDTQLIALVLAAVGGILAAIQRSWAVVLVAAAVVVLTASHVF
jgi:hypothetical protein